MSALNVCYMCEKEFTLCKNLYAHLRKVHKFNSNALGKVESVKCPKDGCSFSCNFLHNLRWHVQNEHMVEMVRERLVFQSLDDFLQWKAKEEKATRSSFVKRGGATCAKDGTEKVTFFCHRSGRFRSTSEGKRMLKSVGSYKLGSHCTAAIDLNRDKSGSCVVIYFKTHFGHELDIGYLHLSRLDREVIAGKIAEGVPFEKILDQVRGSIQNGTVERLHLLTRQDLHNIKRNIVIGNTYSSLQGRESSEMWIESRKRQLAHSGSQPFN